MESTVQLRLFGTLRKYRPPNAERFPLPPESTVQTVLDMLDVPPEKVHLLFVNGAQAGPDHPLGDGDTVGVFPAVGGG